MPRTAQPYAAGSWTADGGRNKEQTLGRAAGRVPRPSPLSGRRRIRAAAPLKRRLPAGKGAAVFAGAARRYPPPGAGSAARRIRGGVGLRPRAGWSRTPACWFLQFRSSPGLRAHSLATKPARLRRPPLGGCAPVGPGRRSFPAWLVFQAVICPGGVSWLTRLAPRRRGWLVRTSEASPRSPVGALPLNPAGGDFPRAPHSGPEGLLPVLARAASLRPGSLAMVSIGAQ